MEDDDLEAGRGRNSPSQGSLRGTQSPNTNGRGNADGADQGGIEEAPKENDRENENGIREDKVDNNEEDGDEDEDDDDDDDDE